MGLIITGKQVNHHMDKTISASTTYLRSNVAPPPSAVSRSFLFGPVPQSPYHVTKQLTTRLSSQVVSGRFNRLASQVLNSTQPLMLHSTHKSENVALTPLQGKKKKRIKYEAPPPPPSTPRNPHLRRDRDFILPLCCTTTAVAAASRSSHTMAG